MVFNVTLFVIVLYLLAIILVGYFRGREEHLLDFTVNRRRTSTLLLTTAGLSTAFGIGSILGVSAEAYRTGISYGLSTFFVVTLGFLLLIWLGPKIKRFGDSHNAQTIADFFAEKYSVSASTITSVVTIFAFLLIASAQFIGIASLASVITNVSWSVALVIAAIITIAYTSFGGLRNDIMTDFIQFWIILAMLVVMIPFSFIKQGGFDILRTLPVTSFNPFAYGGPVFFFGSMILGALVMITQMDVWQRTYSAKSESTVRKAYVWSFIIAIPLYVLPVLFGLMARQLYPGIVGEQSLFTLMLSTLPSWLLGIGFAGILAAAMSSIDSMIIVGSTSFANDIYARYIHKKEYEHHLLNKTRLFAVVFGTIALLIAYFVPNIVKLVVLGTFLTLNFLPAILGGFFWRKANAKAAFWSILVSTIILVASWIPLGTDAWLPAFFSSMIIYLVGGWISYKPRIVLERQSQ